MAAFRGQNLPPKGINCTKPKAQQASSHCCRTKHFPSTQSIEVLTDWQTPRLVNYYGAKSQLKSLLILLLGYSNEVCNLTFRAIKWFLKTTLSRFSPIPKIFWAHYKVTKGLAFPIQMKWFMIRSLFLFAGCMEKVGEDIFIKPEPEEWKPTSYRTRN